MKPVEVPLETARAIALDAQGLSRPAPFGQGKQGVLRALDHLGYVQIDTISVVERAHHHVLWSRVPDYRPAILHELQAGERRVFEYWSHAASYLPMRDYRFCLPRMRSYARGKSHWFRKDPKVTRYVLDRIRAEGPLQAKDFEAEPGRKAGPWFEWKPAKKALEQLFMEGSLMVRERRGFQKVYDVAERVLPGDVDTHEPSAAELGRYLVERGLRSHGIVSEAEIRYLRKNMQRPVATALRELESLGAVIRVRVRGIERESYFCLPLLQGDRLVGRMDAKADREKGMLEVRSVHWEIPRAARAEARERFGGALREFAEFNGCGSVRLPGRAGA